MNRNTLKDFAVSTDNTPPYKLLPVFDCASLWTDPTYSISRLFDGFESDNLPISFFLMWNIPTEEEILAMEPWVQIEAISLKNRLLDLGRTSENPEMFKEGSLILIYKDGER